MIRLRESPAKGTAFHLPEIIGAMVLCVWAAYAFFSEEYVGSAILLCAAVFAILGRGPGDGT